MPQIVLLEFCHRERLAEIVSLEKFTAHIQYEGAYNILVLCAKKILVKGK